MQPLDIALVITDLSPGGAERCLVELATRLEGSRFRPAVYCLAAEPLPGEDGCLEALQAAGIVVHCLGGRRNWQFLSVTARLTRLLRRQRPVLVQSFLFHANIAGRIAARRAGVPVVLSGIRVAQASGRWRLWLERWTNGLVSRHVCVSRAVAEFSATRGRLPAEKLVVIPNGVDLARFPSAAPADLASLGIPPGSDVVTYIGRLERQKRVGWLLEGAAAWLAQLPACHLLVVGKGPERGRLEGQCGRLDISGRVHFAGWRADVPGILAASRLLVLPSAWEGMPNVVLEAMASRLPVVATDVEGVRELLGAAADRQVAAADDADGFLAKVAGFLKCAEAARRVGLENRRRVEESFTLPQMVAAYVQLWESLLPATA